MMTLLTRVNSAVQLAGSRLSRFARQYSALALLLDAWNAYGRDEMATLAAALGYYFILALFPLLLLLIAVASPFIASEQVTGEAVRIASSYVPTLARELGPVLNEVVEARGAVSLIALVGLLWSASGVFDVVQRGLNRAWRVARPRPVWRQRLVSLTAVVAIVILFAASFAISAFTRSGLHLRFRIGNESVELVGVIASTTINFLLFAVAYRLLPNARVRWQHVWGAALLASVFWEIAKILFVLYLLNFARLNLIYGSVGAVIALLTWGYITATILLFGAEVAALNGRNSEQTDSVARAPELPDARQII